jgi:putative spermidine/putrescine transport system ATP-binding protein
VAKSEATPGAELEIRSAVKCYDGKVAVEDICLSVAAGEFVTLLGPSGSGKTTVLNLIAGFTALDGGDVLLGGRSIAREPTHRRNIGVVFQHYALFPHMTAVQNVAFPLRERRLDRREVNERAHAALARVELDEFAERYPWQLSGGQQQRVAVARALVFEPALLLMDEPLGALDVRLRESLQLEIRRLHRELGITFLYVTHDQREAMTMSERIAVFNRGHIEQCGTPQELYDHPTTEFVAAFFGNANRFSGTVAPDNGHIECHGFKLAIERAERSATDASVLVVRYEDLDVLPVDAPIPVGHNQLTGGVRDVVYLGADLRIEIELDVGMDAVAQVRSHVGRSLMPGERVNVAWPPHAGSLVSASPGAFRAP